MPLSFCGTAKKLAQYKGCSPSKIPMMNLKKTTFVLFKCLLVGSAWSQGLILSPTPSYKWKTGSPVLISPSAEGKNCSVAKICIGSVYNDRNNLEPEQPIACKASGDDCPSAQDCFSSPSFGLSETFPRKILPEEGASEESPPSH